MRWNFGSSWIKSCLRDLISCRPPIQRITYAEAVELLKKSGENLSSD